MKQTKHQPGVIVKRQFNNYSEFQDALWNAFDDFYYADVGGYGATRMPTPGKVVEPVNSYNLDFNDWKLRVIQRWKAEAGRDNQTRGVSSEDEFSDNLWYYLYERFLDATNTHHKPKVKAFTPVNSTCPDPGAESFNTNQHMDGS
tara:strand:+ start:18194 stop:18628 length:435 start_codon:yes stop_codon:yes gene_type:complete